MTSINYNQLKIYLITIFGISFALVLGHTAASGERNALAEIAKYLTIGIACFGIVRPLYGMYLLVFLTAYTDLVKRMLLLFGNLSYFDIALVLGVCPILVTAISIGSIFIKIFSKSFLNYKEFFILFITLLSASFSFLSSTLLGSPLVESLKDIANSSIYLLLVWLVILFLNTRNKIKRYLRFTILVYFPVALYGIYQSIFGYSNMEKDYLLSGLTINVGLLDAIKERPFSTMNSTHAYALVMAFMMVIAFYLGFRSDKKNALSKLLFFVYAIALFSSFGRSWMLSGAFMIIGSFVFCFRRSTIFAYMGGMTIITFGILYSEDLLGIIGYMNDRLPLDTAWQKQMLQVGTFSDRLMGYRNVLLEPTSWKLFGDLTINSMRISQSDAFYSHDILSQMIIRLGILPTFMLSAGLLSMIFYFHKMVFVLPSIEQRRIGGFLISIVSVFFYSNLLGSSMALFPVNVFVWIFVGMLIVVISEKKISNL